MITDHKAFLFDCIDEKLAGILKWNQWRKDFPDVQPNLESIDFRGRGWHPSKRPGIDLSSSNLMKANFTEAQLNYADFSNSNLIKAKFNKAIIRNSKFINCELRSTNFEWSVLNNSVFTGANHAAAFAHTSMTGVVFDNCNLRSSSFIEANLKKASFKGADLTSAYLTDANLLDADLSNANLSKANLQRISLVNTTIEGAVITEAKIHGISAWNLKGTPKVMNKLLITSDDESAITVDDIDIAQFIHLLLKREKLRNVIETITSKAVLILGRFTTERKEILDLLADELRKYDLLPIIFDFEKASSRDFTETIKVLAGLSFFVIADITKPRSIPQELSETIPDYRIPFIPIIAKGETPYAMFQDFVQKFYWIYPTFEYDSKEVLLNEFKKIFIDRAYKMQQQINAVSSEKKGVQTIADLK